MDKTVEFYVVLRDENQNDPYRSNVKPKATRMTIGKPRMERGEVAVKVRLTVSEERFREFIPTVEAEIGSNMLPGPTGEVVDPA